jgi:hypothetical protein
MPIKKRPPVDPAAREAAIEAFGKAANYDPATEVETAAPTPAPQRTVGAARRANPARAKVKPAGEKAEVKPMLMRFDSDQHELLKEVAALEGRSMHNMALTALIPALEAIRDAHQK